MKNVRNLVLVHGAFADASGWKGVFDILSKEGYNVTAVQNPLISLDGDVEMTILALDKQDGPVVLVGHSWGGAVISIAGNHPKVAALVYVAAFAPDEGESVIELLTSARPPKEIGVLPADDKGIVYYDKAKWQAGFCADVPKDTADFMWASQGAFHNSAFATKLGHPAWKDKPSYAVVATEDQTISPVIERNMYTRAKSKITEIKASHAVYVSQPKLVAGVIMEAADSLAINPS